MPCIQCIVYTASVDEYRYRRAASGGNTGTRRRDKPRRVSPPCETQAGFRSGLRSHEALANSPQRGGRASRRSGVARQRRRRWRARGKVNGRSGNVARCDRRAGRAGLGPQRTASRCGARPSGAGWLQRTQSHFWRWLYHQGVSMVTPTHLHALTSPPPFRLPATSLFLSLTNFQGEDILNVNFDKIFRTVTLPAQN